ncbi:TIGR00266 family protein [Microbacterium sp. KSW4-16]|uniref:TIGR00266 family protein n=1 Tax=Microbacterium aurugineum TaxID=2851642 RepID=UPI0020C0EF1F|nr:TIGR00266 family protein [Microbacterium aurugineum]MCK8468606.1 TIGR00266 family protein [Microbacterium aurugineum]
MSSFELLPNEGAATGFGYRVDYRPAFPMATVGLAAGASMAAQAGAMVSMSASVELTSKMEGGIMGAIKRSAAGRSAFVSTFTAGSQGGEVVLAPATLGDVVPVRLEGEYLIAASGYLASEPAIDIDTRWGGSAGFFGSNSLFILRASGSGVMFLTAFGALHQKQLAAGEEYIVDTGHVVAWDSTLKYKTKKAASSLFRSVTSAEGLVAHFTGPGVVLMQTRNVEAFAGSLSPFIGASSGSGGDTVSIFG